ncbi:MAG TPA: COX15/CtaA family protein [Thermoanaerobaculia bacterium]|nr:COX15/CtaA family protein [Thermoanaerobaculia bacterium]
MPAAPASQPRFARFAWGLLVYNLGVILWGAFVRATGSGAGCGNHWPLCNGEVAPRAPSVETMIELTHRLTSGLDGLLVLALAVWAWRAFPRGDRVRRYAALSLAFLVSEALVGAGLVKFELVADDASVERGLVMAVHLVNTFLLIAFLALTAAWAGRPTAQRSRVGAGGAAALLRDPVAWVLGATLAATLVLGVSGAIAALGDTLFPAASLREGIAQDLDPGAHLFVRLRVFHPLLALLVLVLGLQAAAFAARRRPRPEVRRRARQVTVLFGIEIVAGLVNLALAAPVVLQLVHLLLADLVWIALVLLASAAVAPAAAPEAAHQTVESIEMDAVRISGEEGENPGKIAV